MTLKGILLVVVIVIIIGAIANSLERGSSVKDTLSLASRVPGIFTPREAVQDRDIWEFVVIRQLYPAIGSPGPFTLKHLPSNASVNVHPSLYDETSAWMVSAGWELTSKREQGRTLAGAYMMETMLKRHL